MVPEDTMPAVKGGKQLAVLSSCNAYEPQPGPAWQDVHEGVNRGGGTQQLSKWT